MSYVRLDEKEERILLAIKNKVRPYTKTEICQATKLSSAVVWKRLDRLKDAGLLEERWVNERCFWELPGWAERNPGKRDHD